MCYVENQPCKVTNIHQQYPNTRRLKFTKRRSKRATTITRRYFYVDDVKLINPENNDKYLMMGSIYTETTEEGPGYSSETVLKDLMDKTFECIVRKNDPDNSHVLLSSSYFNYGERFEWKSEITLRRYNVWMCISIVMASICIWIMIKWKDFIQECLQLPRELWEDREGKISDRVIVMVLWLVIVLLVVLFPLIFLPYNIGGIIKLVDAFA